MAQGSGRLRARMSARTGTCFGRGQRIAGWPGAWSATLGKGGGSRHPGCGRRQQMGSQQRYISIYQGWNVGGDQHREDDKCDHRWTMGPYVSVC